MKKRKSAYLNLCTKKSNNFRNLLKFLNKHLVLFRGNSMKTSYCHAFGPFKRGRLFDERC